MENNGNDIFDPVETGGETADSGYVPRFERDLQKMGGNLDALADAKKAEQQAAENIRPAKEQPPKELTEADYDEYDEDDDDGEAFEYIEEEEEEVISHSPYHSKPIDESAYESGNYRRGKTIEELMQENEEQSRIEAEKAKKLAAEEAYRNLEDVTVSADMLGDMGYNFKQQERKEKLKKQELDDLATEIGSQPKLEEMSTKYQPTAPLKKESTFSSQEALDREEKQLIKERLQKEIDSRPKGIN